ncbi:MAG: DUF3179 domain-containing (seleno)protein [Isosphaeraceae bacterium]
MSMPSPFALRKGWSTTKVLAAVIALQVAGIVLVFFYERSARQAEEARMSFNLSPDVWWVENPAKGVSKPPVVRASETTLIRPDDYVIGVIVGGKARAYRLLSFDDESGHHVNDLVGDVPVSVTYCNISHCVRVYTDASKHEPLDVEVSGLMNGKMIVKLGGILYFNQSGVPVEPAKNPPPIPYDLITPYFMTWKDWKHLHPDTEVFEGKPTAVAQEPVRWLNNPAKPIVRPPTRDAKDATLRPAEQVIGVEVAGKARAYRVAAFDDASGHLVNDLIGDVPVSVAYSNINHSARVYTDAHGHEPLDAEVAGLRISEMVVRLGNGFYFHESGLPIDPAKNPAPMPYTLITPVVTTWNNWRQIHPDTDVFEGGRANEPSDSVPTKVEK